MFSLTRLRHWLPLAYRRARKPTLVRRLVVEALEERTLLSTYYVSTTGNDANPGTQAQPYRHIQAAIDAATTVDGDTIVVAPGTYVENITISKALTMNGANAGINPNTGTRGSESIVLPATEDLDPLYTNFPGDVSVVSILSDHVTFDGFTVDGNSPGVGTGVYNQAQNIACNDGITITNTATSVTGFDIIRNNIVKNVAISGIDIGNYHDAGGTPTGGNVITQNFISNVGLDANDTGGDAIDVAYNAFTDVTNNVSLKTAFGVAVVFFDDVDPVDATHPVTVTGNQISTTNGGINLDYFFDPAVWYFVSGNTISAEIVTSNVAPVPRWHGLATGNVLAAIDGNHTFEKNTLNASALAGGGTIAYGISADTDSDLGLVSQNFVSGMNDAVHIGDNANPQTRDTLTQIFDNNLSGNSGFGVNNVTTTTITAYGNWWGSNVSATVASLASGPVTQTPFLQSAVDTKVTPGFQGNFFTSANNATFNVGVNGPAFTVTTLAFPNPSALSISASLPSGLTFTDNGNGTATINGTPAAGTAGTYNYTLNAINLGASSAQAFTLTIAQASTTPPTISTFTVNGNDANLAGAQRSRVTNLVYVFDQAVTLDAGTFSMALHAGTTATGGLSLGTIPTVNFANPSLDGVTWVVTFGGSVESGSVMDGVYDITMDHTKVHLASSPATTLAANDTRTFFRLFGDNNGDRVVGISDYNAFLSAFGKTAPNPAYKAWFDFNNDTTINIPDYNAFLARFGKGYTFS